MSVTAGLGKLERAEKDLRRAWAEVRASWYDRNSEIFEEKYVTPLLARLKTMKLLMGTMATTLQKARTDCE
jgi:hypothetical protein